MISLSLFAARAALVVITAQTFVIENTDVEDGDGTVQKAVTVVVADGVVTAVAKGAPAPAGATRIDGTGKVVTPGLFEVKTAIGLVEIDAEPVATDAFVMQPFTPAYRPSDAFHLDSTRFAVARKSGVTHIVTAPIGGVLSGQGMLKALDDTPLTARARVIGVYGSVDELVKPLVGGTRGMLWVRMREIVDDARTYGKKRAAYESGASRPFTLAPAQLDALTPVLAGTVPLVLEADSATDIRAILTFVDEENARGSKIRVVITGAREAWTVKDELARRQIAVVLTPSMQVPDTFGALAARDDAPAILDQAGVPLILSTNGWANNAARLRQEAGIAVAHGLPRDRALRAITSTPARALGVTDMGTVTVGARAHLVLWSGDPLELSTRAERVFIDGKDMSLATRHRALADKYRARK
jgi:imidazolonepropionase-like amidohydrolase